MNTINWRNATPEQKLLWDYASALIAYTTITPLYYQGTNAGSEFLTYNVGKLYIALEFVSFYRAAELAAVPVIELYNEANAIFSTIGKINAFWNTTAAANRYFANYLNSKNLYFSRIVCTQYTYIKFIGYRLNV